MIKFTKRLLAMGLSVAMLVSCLAGCSSSSSESETTTATSSTSSGYATSEYTTCGLVYSGDVVEDILGLPADTVIGTLNGEDLTLLDLTYWLTYEANILAYYSYGSLDSIVWEDTYSDDQTIADFVLSDVLSVAVNYKLIELKAAEYGLTLTDEDIAEIDDVIQNYIDSFGLSLWEAAVEAGTVVEDDYDDEAYAAWVQAAGEDDMQNEVAIYVTTVEFLRYMNEVYCLYDALGDLLFGEGGEYAPSDEDIAQYAEDEGYYCSQSILFMYLTDDEGNSVAYADMDDDQKAELQAKAQAALDDILSSDDPDATFEAYQLESDDTGSNTAGATYLFQDGYMVDEFFEGVAALEVGELGTELVVSEDYGYFIVKRCAVSADDVPTYYSSYGYTTYTMLYLYTNDAYATLVSEWTDSATIVTNDVYASIDMTDYCAKLVELEELLYPSTSTDE